MSAPATAAVTDRHANYNKSRIFLVSVLGLVAAGMAASLRANTAADLQSIFLDPIDRTRGAEMIANILAVPFIGFALTIAIGSPLLDIIGMGLLLPLAGVMFIAGTLTLVFAGHIASGAGVYDILYIGAVISGIGWGLVETVVNPLIATLYPEEKTAKLNHLHAWWPGGLIIGGLLGVGMTSIGMNWQLKLAAVMVPAVAVLLLCLGMKFPPTERAAAGVSTGAMFKELAQPMFLVLFLAMFGTAASELAPGQWVDLALSRTVHMPGILLLVYVSGIMFIARHFAGPLVHKLSPIGLLWISCLLASLGLFSLSIADSPVTGVLAATVWGCGVCFMWPTMLATASERFPRGGALLMGLMGTAGTASIYFVLPWMGSIVDKEVARLAGGAEAYKNMAAGPQLDYFKGIAAQLSFKEVAIIPACLLLVFGAIWLYDRSKGGFKPKNVHH
ncbi:MAG TPA: MFS transporter [Bryobacteraceae bacterium]|jgi:MFS family permease|nr:MFS transporter [Bryobacteraceae bacterium]